MKLNELKTIVKTAVKEAIQEEMREILLEAVKGNRQVVNENQTLSMDTNQNQWRSIETIDQFVKINTTQSKWMTMCQTRFNVIHINQNLSTSIEIDKEQSNSENDLETIKYQFDLSHIESQDGAHHPNLATPEDISYIIYTSGSTGKPKGAIINFFIFFIFFSLVVKLFIIILNKSIYLFSIFNS